MKTISTVIKNLQKCSSADESEEVAAEDLEQPDIPDMVVSTDAIDNKSTASMPKQI